MKKIISLVLVLVMCLSLCGFGQNTAVQEVETAISAIGEVSVDSREAIETAEGLYSALPDKVKEQVKNYNTLVEAQKAYIFALAKDAYKNIDSAYDITLQFAEDFYKAWRIGIYEKSKVQGNFAEYLSSELSLSKEDIIVGMAWQMGQAMAGKEWDELTEDQKNEYIELASGEFIWKGSVFGFLTWSVRNAYIANGETEKAQSCLNNAKAQMRVFSKQYSDYEHYPNLKGYYTTTNSFLEFISNPSGTFDMLVDTINNYMNKACDYSADLDYIFED